MNKQTDILRVIWLGAVIVACVAFLTWTILTGLLPANVGGQILPASQLTPCVMMPEGTMLFWGDIE